MTFHRISISDNGSSDFVSMRDMCRSYGNTVYWISIQMDSLEPLSCRSLGTSALLLLLLLSGNFSTGSLDKTSTSACCTHSSYLEVSQTFLSLDYSISASVCLSNTQNSSVRSQVNYFLLLYSAISLVSPR